jgi:hypothetical protein
VPKSWPPSVLTISADRPNHHDRGGEFGGSIVIDATKVTISARVMPGVEDQSAIII